MKNLGIFLILLWGSLCWGQNDSIPPQVISQNPIVDSLVTSSSSKKKKGFVKRFWTEDYPSPKKAVILTGVLPGLGQIYNKKHWYIKLPLIYGAFGGLIYAIDENTTVYRFYRDEYKKMVDGDENTVSVLEGQVSTTVLKNARDQRRKWMEMSYIGIGLAYILTAAEAYSTAHLLSFDVDDDLSLQLKPSIDFAPTQGAILGFGVTLKFGKTKTAQALPLILEGK